MVHAAWNVNRCVGNDGGFVYFRFYAPEQAFFDKTFKLVDFEMVGSEPTVGSGSRAK
ncbi:hypothetical protein ABID59_002714 [Bradyrhizobium sp. S3.3.6]|uniref:hypothetical protein n=1 Tax=Bradyrhizobium sp. S3.3.6 TaxID=3156429 RepID=UPI003394C280